MSKKMKFTLLLLFFTFVNTVWAIDNPDAPDYVAEFEARILPLEDSINKEAMTTYEYTKAYALLNESLEKELKLVYKNLMLKLPEKCNVKLRESQEQWLKYIDLELKFISEHFNNTNYGSSASISRGGYRSEMITARIKQLLRYLSITL